jgi:hypothetical protein
VHYHTVLPSWGPVHSRSHSMSPLSMLAVKHRIKRLIRFERVTYAFVRLQMFIRYTVMQQIEVELEAILSYLQLRFRASKPRIFRHLDVERSCDDHSIASRVRAVCAHNCRTTRSFLGARVPSGIQSVAYKRPYRVCVLVNPDVRDKQRICVYCRDKLTFHSGIEVEPRIGLTAGIYEHESVPKS